MILLTLGNYWYMKVSNIVDERCFLTTYRSSRISITVLPG